MKAATVTANLTKRSPKTKTAKLNTLWVITNLRLAHRQIPLFREAVLKCISNEADCLLVSNEYDIAAGQRKTQTTFPRVQFRSYKGKAAIFARQEAVPIIERILHKYMKMTTNGAPFPWGNSGFLLKAESIEKNHLFELQLQAPHIAPPGYRLNCWLPFNKHQKQSWWYENRHLTDVEKTKKLEQVLVSHLCTVLFYNGGYIPRKKIKLSILDKKPLKDITYKGYPWDAFDVRFTVNLQLPAFIGLGNHSAFGFGWVINE